MTTAAPPSTAVPKKGGGHPGRENAEANRRRRTRGAYLLLLPTIVVMALVVGYPIVLSVINSFQTNSSGIDPKTGMVTAGGFVGFENYLHWILQRCKTTTGGYAACAPGNLGNSFWPAAFQTFFFTVATVIPETLIGTWMAIIMNRNFRGRGILRAAVLVPWAIPTAVTAQLWAFMFASSGIVNKVFNLNTIWGSDLWASRFAIVIADTWKTTPFMALLILAGLQLIPEDVYEAARMDGASTVQQFVRITVPLLKPALVVAILFRTLDALRMYDLPAILTHGGGGRGDATTTLSMLVVDQLGGTNSQDIASALSTITFILIFAVAFIFIRLLGANVTGSEKKSRKVANEL